jgi:hypothetical protein
VSHTKRVGNLAAHELAKLGLGRHEDHVWREGYPSCIHDAVAYWPIFLCCDL